MMFYIETTLVSRLAESSFKLDKLKLTHWVHESRKTVQ